MKNHLLTAVLAVALSACQAGKTLDYNSVQSIQRNVTTEAQIRAQFGEPVAVHTDAQNGTRTLLYRYKQSDEIKKPLAGIVGTAAGAALGYQIGDGSGQAVATALGGMAGGAIAGNAVTTRRQERNLQVIISLASGRVTDYRYSEDAYRSQPWTPAPAPSRL